MVRTMRSIEEEARVHRVAGTHQEAFLADESLAALLEGDILKELVAWGTDGVRRALVVGLEDRGRIALALARAGVFVTVVEPDESLHEPVKVAAEAARCGIQLNFYASDYMKRDFAASGFDLAVFYATLSNYNEPLVVLKKAARELRAGGRLFARVRVRPSLAPVARLVGRLPRGAEVVRKAGELAARVPRVQAVLALPDGAALLEGVGEVFKVERTIRYHLVAPLLGRLGTEPRVPAQGRRWLAKALPAAVKADALALRARPLANLATHLAFFGVKELGLGRTFRL